MSAVAIKTQVASTGIFSDVFRCADFSLKAIGWCFSFRNMACDLRGWLLSYPALLNAAMYKTTGTLLRKLRRTIPRQQRYGSLSTGAGERPRSVSEAAELTKRRLMKGAASRMGSTMRLTQRKPPETVYTISD